MLCIETLLQTKSLESDIVMRNSDILIQISQ